MRTNFTTKGLTLVEVIVYIGGMILVLSAISISVMETYRVYLVLTNEARIDRVGISIVDELTREIRSGMSIDQSDSVFGVDEGLLTINAQEGEVTVSKYFGLENGRIVYREDGGGAVYLTPEDVTVSKLHYSQVVSDASYGVRYEIDLTYILKGVSNTETYSGFAILRHSYE